MQPEDILGLLLLWGIVFKGGGRLLMMIAALMGTGAGLLVLVVAAVVGIVLAA